MRALTLMAFAAVLHAGTGSSLMKSIREAGLDPRECYRVRDLSIARDEAQVFFTDGYLIFGKPVGSSVVTAVFSAAVEGGDGELLLLPPNRAERRALAKHTAAPNLEEHFSEGVFVFADNTYRELMEQISASGYIKKTPEMGFLLAEKWGPLVRNVSESFSLRLTLDLLSPATARKGFFAAALSGRRLGAFDLVYDSRSREQLLAGQGGAAGFDIWTSFVSRSFRAKPFSPEFKILDYRIDAAMDPDLTLHCTTNARLQPLAEGEHALPFEISRKMHVTSAKIDGEPAELLMAERPRESLAGTADNDFFVVVPPRALQAGKIYDVELRHEGNVVSDTGNRVYFVGSRGTWYPGRGMQFARFDLTFHYPAHLNLVSTGDPIEDKLEGERRMTHRVTPSPVRMAGFNLGIYEMLRMKRGDFTIEVCANKTAERALTPAPQAAVFPAQAAAGIRRSHGAVDAIPPPPQPPPSTTAHLQTLAADVAEVMNFYTARFGPPPTKMLEVTPVPARFGQGFPGLIYLSTLSYLQTQETFFSDLLHAHEAAHQWWGNIVTSAGYHDDWIMEALSNYSALLYLEKKKGPAASNAFLDEYRTRLLAKGEDGNTVESAGPVVQGTRVEGNWNAVVYGKGTWIMHMLRRKLGDDAFWKMLAGLRKTFEDKSISTEDFRAFCAGYLPAQAADAKLEGFFDQWVYGTGIPVLKLEYRLSAGKIVGSVKQSGVDEDFSADVPVEILQGRLKAQTLMVRSAGEPAAFTAKVTAPVTKVRIDTHGILSR